MKVLVIGGGGREHALAWKLAQSPKVEKIYVAPGNAGTATFAENLPMTETKDIVAWVDENRPDLVVVGPDDYLAAGIVDLLEDKGFSVFGPTAAAAEIEWSKSFAKKFMQEEGIPTASHETFTDFKSAENYLLAQPPNVYPLVIKASGLALGKGVVIAETAQEAHDAIARIMRDKVHGEAGDVVLIEEYLRGKEISVHAFCDGERAVLFPSSQDHKRIFDGDRGPNTGGMGTIAPVPGVTAEQMKAIEEQIVLPALRGLKKRNWPFRGLLYPGIMLTEAGPKVIEFNARFGDPETQAYMRLLKSDLFDILCACARGKLVDIPVEWLDESACCIIAASKGYPDKYEKGKVITFSETEPGIEIFHAGTKMEGENKIVTNGGRVLGITATGTTLPEALEKAYQAKSAVSFEGMYMRTDIGAKALQK